MQHDTAGWYADPRERYHGRYYDGTQWTADVCDRDLQSMIDPRGIAPSNDSDDAEMADVDDAKRFAAHDQELIRRAQDRFASAGATAPSSERRDFTRVGKLAVVAICVACLGWWAVSAGGAPAVVTKVDDATEQQSGEGAASLSDVAAPRQLATNDHDGETAARRAALPAWSQAAQRCTPRSPAIDVAHPALPEPGQYLVELCQGVLRLTPANDDADAATELLVGDDALVLPDGVVVSWRPADTTSIGAAISWDMTFWGGDAARAKTIRVAAVLNELGVPRPPTPLPGGYVLALPVDVLLAGEVTIELPTELATTTDA